MVLCLLEKDCQKRGTVSVAQHERFLAEKISLHLIEYKSTESS